ncbi:MAG TPA: hypothetical protein PK812_10980 [Beijerinckiaceae bacterium]|nr:hypothetical protein [Beijerinckiaceae bacterium]
MLRAKPWLGLSAGLVVLYLVYLLWSKFARALGAPPVRLSETGEFLFFFLAIVAFTVQVIVDERRTKGSAGR